MTGARPSKPRGAGASVPVERVIRVASFRSDLRTFLNHSERICRSWGLTPQRYLLLLMIKGAPDGSERRSFTDIAEALSLSRNTVTELVARAEDAGLVSREPSDFDQRVVYLRLTREGERRLLGVIDESELQRRELQAAFDELTASFRSSGRSRAGRR